MSDQPCSAPAMSVHQPTSSSKPAPPSQPPGNEGEEDEPFTLGTPIPLPALIPRSTTTLTSMASNNTSIVTPLSAVMADPSLPILLSISELAYKLSFFLITYVFVCPPNITSPFLYRLPSGQLYTHCEPLTFENVCLCYLPPGIGTMFAAAAAAAAAAAKEDGKGASTGTASATQTAIPNNSIAYRIPTKLIEQITGCYAVEDPLPIHRTKVHLFQHPAFAPEIEKRCGGWKRDVRSKPEEWISIAQDAMDRWVRIWEPPACPPLIPPSRDGNPYDRRWFFEGSMRPGQPLWEWDLKVLEVKEVGGVGDHGQGEKEWSLGTGWMRDGKRCYWAEVRKPSKDFTLF